jgi:hypothetical protein
MRTMPQGLITYQGPSRIDGAPIVSILTGLDGSSKNPKTGAMIQHWIIRADQHPAGALQTGGDAAICGDCPLRPQADGKGRLCYVNIMGPASVYRAFLAGKYVADDGQSFDLPLRFGAYGDPAALPVDHALELVSRATKGHTGYTHQWRDRKVSRLRAALMASVETFDDLALAHAKGWRTFRVIDATPAAMPGVEIICPASPEGGYRATCAQCGLCQGQARPAKSIAIVVHGANKAQFIRR